MANVSIFCFLASYLLALGLEAVRLVRRTTISRAALLAFAAAGLVAHTAFLYFQSQRASLPPLLSSTRDWMLVLAWVVVVLYLFLTSVDRDLAIGVFLLPLVLLLVGAAYFVSGAPNAALANDLGQVRYAWAMLHASLLVFGIAGVLVGFVLSMMYLVQHRRLKRRQALQNGLTLPSLARLARLNWWAVMISVPLLTLGMGVGVGLTFLTEDRTLSWTDPVVVGNAIAWLAMAALFVWLAKKDHPAGRQVAWLTVWAFGFMLVTVVGLQILAGEGLVPFDSSVHRR